MDYKEKEKMFREWEAEQKNKTLWMIARVPFPDGEPTQFQERQNFQFEILEKKFNKESMATKNFKELGILRDMMMPSKKILEIGSGAGITLRDIRTYDNKLTGIEVDKKTFDFSVKKLTSYNNIKLINVSVEEAKLESDYYDYITSYHVIEHIKNPIEFLEKTWNWLKPGGYSVIACPNVEGLHPRLNLKNWRQCYPTHRWLPGKKSLSRIIKTIGFDIEKVITYGGFPAPRGFFKEIGNKLLKKFNLGDGMVFLLKKNIDNNIDRSYNK